MALTAGTRLGQYEIEAPLGAGGMGEVYRAHDTRLDRAVAVKVLTGADPLGHARLLREARAAAALDHSNICPIYEVGEDEGRGFIVMPLLHGETLAARLRRGALSLPEALDVGMQLADALAEAHAHGVIHRDVKPQNLIVTPRGQIKVLDFGLAKVAPRGGTEADTRTATAFSRAGVIKGTPGYMSPEQVRGEPLDARSDAFSFGTVLYEMVTGRRPYPGESAAEQMAAVLSTDPAPIARYAPDTPPELQRIISKCLERTPDRRYQTLRDVATDLEMLRRSFGTGARAVSSLPWRRAPWIAAAVLVAATIAGAGAWIWDRRAPSEEIRSLAILPLRAVTANPEGNHVGLGIADSVITKIGTVGGLAVRPTSAIHRYAKEEMDSMTAAKQLGVDAVLEGTWRRDGDRFRVSANLLRVRDGASLWADTLDMRWSDVFTVEDRLSQELIGRLRVTLDAAARTRLAKRHTSNPEAYEYYTKAMYLFGDRFESGVLQGIDLLHKAVALDPQYALAHAQLGYNYAWRSIFIEGTPDWIDEAKQAVARAVALDRELPQAYVVRAFIVWSQFEGWKVEEAIRELRRARTLDPAIGDIELAELYWHIGLEDLAETLHERAIAQNPASEGAKTSYINEYYLSNRPDHAAAAARRFGRQPDIRYFLEKRLTAELDPLVTAALAKDPNGPFNRSYRGLLLALRGRHDEAQAYVPHVFQYARVNRSYHHLTYNVARIYAMGGNVEAALKWLQVTAGTGFPQYRLFQRDTYLDPIRNDPAFRKWLDGIRVQWERYQRDFG